MMPTVPSAATNAELVTQRNVTRTASNEDAQVAGLYPGMTGSTAVPLKKLPNVLVFNGPGEEPQQELPQVQRSRSLPAVVLEVTDVSVAIACQTGANESIRISLPRDLIPDDLARYGTPVTLSLEQTRHVRYPKVVPRMYTRTAPKTPEEIEIDRWVDSL
jgi:hypothetical protein